MAEKKVKRPFEQMNNNEKYLLYNRRSKKAILGKWASIIAPFGIVFGAKFNEYVQILDTWGYVKLSVGCLICIVVAVVALYKEMKHSEETKHLAPAFGWLLATVIIFCFYVIIKDLLVVVASETVGQFTAWGIETYGEHAKEEAKAYKELARRDNTLGTKRSKYIIQVTR